MVAGDADGGGSGEGEDYQMPANAYRAPSWRDENVPELDCGDGCTTL